MTRLSALLDDPGAMAMQVAFGPTATPVAAGDLVRCGQRYYADQADNDRIGILMTNDRPTVEVLLGAVVRGAMIVSLPLPGRGADVEAYARFIGEVLRTQSLDEVVVADAHANLLEAVGIPVRRHSELGHGAIAAPSSDGFQLVQFTSGSTGQPRPVVVDDGRLGANIEAILSVVQPRPGDAVVSWLPLSHDMGLVGMLLTGLAGGGVRWANGGDIVLLEPTTFLRDPRSWLAALDHWRGTISATPDFGLRLAVRRPPSGNLDLSSTRCLIVGGEIVRADTLHSFASALGSRGLGRKALCPAYGMAEAGLAVSLTSPEERWDEVTVSTSALAGGAIDAPESSGDTTALVASGSPLPRYRVRCPTGTEEVGDIHISGPSLGVDGTTGRAFADADGWYQSGDVGFVSDGALFVCGRGDDYFVANGRNIYAPTVEAAVGNLPGLRAGRVTAVGLPTGGWWIVAEPDVDSGPSDIGRDMGLLRRDVSRAVVSAGSPKPDEVVFVKPGTLPLTPSGKLQRHRVRRLLTTGALDAVDA